MGRTLISGEELESLSYEAKTTLWVLGYWKELEEEGLANKPPISPVGIAMFDQLVASGFEPKKEDWKTCIKFLKENIIYD